MIKDYFCGYAWTNGQFPKVKLVRWLMYVTNHQKGTTNENFLGSCWLRIGWILNDSLHSKPSNYLQKFKSKSVELEIYNSLEYDSVFNTQVFICITRSRQYTSSEVESRPVRVLRLIVRIIGWEINEKLWEEFMSVKGFGIVLNWV